MNEPRQQALYIYNYIMDELDKPRDGSPTRYLSERQRTDAADEIAELQMYDLIELALEAWEGGARWETQTYPMETTPLLMNQRGSA